MKVWVYVNEMVTFVNANTITHFSINFGYDMKYISLINFIVNNVIVILCKFTIIGYCSHWVLK